MSIINEARKHLRDSLMRNSLFIMGGTALSSLLSFAFWILVARSYTVADVGLAGALVAAMGLVVAFSTLGFHISVIRFMPMVEDKRDLVNTCFTIVALSSIVASGVFFASSPLISNLMNWSQDLSFVQDSRMLTLAFILVVCATVLFRLQGNIFIGSRRAEFSSATQVGAAALKLPLVIALVSLGAFGIFLSWGIAAAVVFFVGLWFVRRVISGYRLTFTFKKAMVKPMARFSFVNYVSEVLGNAPMYILPLIVLGALGAEQAAYYYIAYGIVGVLGLVAASVLQSLFAEGATNADTLHTTSIRAIKIMALLTAPALALVFIIGDKILLAFGSQYSENSFALLRILSLALIPHTINELYVTICMVRFKLRHIFYVNLARALLIPSLVYLLLSREGLVGVGRGYLAAVGAISLVTSILLRRELRRGERTHEDEERKV